VCYHVETSQLIVPILRQIIPVHALQFYFLKNQFLIFSNHLSLSGLFSSAFRSTNVYGRHIYPPPIRTTCPNHLIFLDLITRRSFVEKHKMFVASLRNVLHRLVNSSLRPKFFPRHFVLEHLRLYYSLHARSHALHPI
jgi:hypothetical protein